MVVIGLWKIERNPSENGVSEISLIFVNLALLVLFTLLAERYECRRVVITSNLVFSQWDQIFKDPMTTAAAIDRVVHHSIIVEVWKGGAQPQSRRSRKTY